MTPLRTVTGAAAPLLLANVDTDVITPMQRIVHVRQSELGEWAFEPLRFTSVPAPGAEHSGERRENPAFPLNQPAWRGAPILLAGANFGCGSSRETAVWALQQLGIRVVVAPSFGDIFEGNCLQNGLLPIRLPAEVIETFAALARAEPKARQIFEVDLERCRIRCPDGSERTFVVDPWRRDALLAGRDEIEQTLTRANAIDAWQSRDRAARPWVWARH